MKIHHFRPGADFLMIPNETARDERLSFAARGMLAYLLSRGDRWDTSADKESKRAQGHRGRRGDGRDAMRRIWKELKDAGYLHEKPVSRSRGLWATDLFLFNQPVTDEQFDLCSDAWFADSPVNQASERPGQTPEPAEGSDNSAPDDEDAFPQVAPTYGNSGVGQPGVGSSGVGQPGVYKKINQRRPEEEDQTQDQDPIRVGGGADDEPVPVEASTVPQSNQVTNSQNRGVRDFPETTAADQAPQFSSHAETATGTGSYARARLATVPRPGSAKDSEVPPSRAWIVKCPYCDSEPGKPCINRGNDDKPTGTHDARIKAAA